MIIFELILTTFKSSVVFRGSWGSCVYWLKTKIDSPLANLACKNPETNVIGEMVGSKYLE